MGQDNKEAFAEVLTEYMKREGWSVERLARETNIPMPTLRHWKEGKTKRPRNWQDVARLSLSLHLNIADASRLSQAAGHKPVLSQIQSLTHADETDRELLAPWIEELEKGERLTDLPRLAHHFTGRKEEVARLVRDLTRLEPGGYIALCGPGGIGKTAVVAQTLHQLYNSGKLTGLFPDGVILHDFYLHPLIEQAMEAIINWFGGDPRPSHDIAARRILSGKRILLVLEGVENTDELSTLMAVTGLSRVLITSRRRQGLPGEEWIDIGPLPQEDSVALLKKWGKERATDEFAVKAICNLVGGLPLAVQLAGSYLVQHGQYAEEFLSWLEQSPLVALDWGERRLQSVPILMAKSVAQVPEGAQPMLALVGLLANAPFTGELAAIALGYDTTTEADRWLGELYNWGLVIRTRWKYQVTHPLLHTYTRQHLDVPKGVLKRLAVHYIALGQEAENGGSAGHHHLESERVHIMAVLKELAEVGYWSEVITMTGVIDVYMDYQGHWIERERASKIGFLAAQKIGDLYSKRKYLNNLGTVYAKQGAYDRAREHYKQALTIAQETGDLRDQGKYLNNLGLTYSSQGSYEQAREYFEQALAIAQKIGDRSNEGKYIGNLGGIYASQGSYEQAREHYKQALTIAQETGDHNTDTIFWGNLGDTYGMQGAYERAREHYKQALTIAQEIGDRSSEGRWLGKLGAIYTNQGAYEQAREYFEQALAIAQEIGDRSGEGGGVGQLGIVYFYQGAYEQAREYFEQTLAIAQEIGARSSEGNFLNYLGIVYLSQGAYEQAREYFEHALAIAQEIGDRSGEGGSLGRLGSVYFYQGGYEQAREYFEQALAIAQEIGDRYGEGSWLGNLANIFSIQRKYELATGISKQALVIAQEIGDKHSEGQILGNLGLTYTKQESYEQAREYFEQALAIAQEIGDRSGEGKALGNLGKVYANIGAYEQAQNYYKQALDILEALQSPFHATVYRWLQNLAK